jgi:hypothetical protein
MAHLEEEAPFQDSPDVDKQIKESQQEEAEPPVYR